MMYGNRLGNGFCSSWSGFGSLSIWHGLIMLGVLVVIVGIFLTIKGKKGKNNNLFELLQIQYVNGSITEEEYMNRKNVLDRK